MTSRNVPESLPPGVYIKRQMESRGWNQSDLSEVMGVDKRTIHELLSAKRRITTKTARVLADVFVGTEPAEWLRFQALYDLAKESLPSSEVSKRRSRLWSAVPVREMISRGWLAETDNIEFLEGQVLQFLGCQAIEDLDLESLRFAARRSIDNEKPTKEQFVWLRRAMNLAESLPVKSGYNPRRFPALLDDLAVLRTEPEESRHVPRVLMEYGIRFLIVEHTRGSKIDGVCFWLGNDPVIALSMRYNRIDWFWYTLSHELGHVYYKHGRDESVVDTSLVGTDAQPSEEKSKEEVQADNFASRYLIDEQMLQRFIINTYPLFSTSMIERFAGQIGVHPGIVVGRLHHIGKLSWNKGNEMLPSVREIIVESAVTDGWGHEVSL